MTQPSNQSANKEFPPLTIEFDIRLYTLLSIRWLAIFGQLFALLFVKFYMGYDLSLVLSLPIVLVSVALNIILMITQGAHHRLSEKSAALQLAYDLTHLTALLFVTGGLANPFAVLMIAPLAFASNILGKRSSLSLLVYATVCVSILALSPYTLPWNGAPPVLEAVYLFAHWLALVFTMIFLVLFMVRIAEDTRRRNRALEVTQAALAKEQKLAAMGTLAAAAAHELGTPLGTIMLAVRDLTDFQDVPKDLKPDIDIIMEEAQRCRNILAEISALRRGELEDPFAFQPLDALVHEAGAPHAERGPKIVIVRDKSSQPVIRRQPEIIHGLRNILENAVGFADCRVDVKINWDDDTVHINISDDGPGFSPHILRQLGEPYISHRPGNDQPDGGLGLGVFIAKTLLERTGAAMSFSNNDLGGASVHLSWPRVQLEGPVTNQEGNKHD